MSRTDSVRNEEERMRAGIESEVASRADKRVLRQRNDGGGCATMRERSERVESPGAYITE